MPDVTEQLAKGSQHGENKFRAHLDGFNFAPSFEGREDVAPRQGILHFDKAGNLTAVWMQDWKISIASKHGNIALKSEGRQRADPLRLLPLAGISPRRPPMGASPTLRSRRPSSAPTSGDRTSATRGSSPAPIWCRILPPAPGDNPLLAPTEGQPDSLAWMEAQIEIATASLLGGLTNNVVLAAGTSGFDVAYPASSTSEYRHTLQHGFENSSNWTAIREITRRHVAMVAKLARTLAATPEIGAEGSMLDHTVIVFMSDNGEQHHSTASDWPKLVIGGNRLGLKTDGRTILYPGAGESRNRQVFNFFNSLGHAFGDPDFNTFGREGSGRIAEGPLSELYG